MSSSRKNGCPSARRARKLTVASSTRSPRASRTSRSLARGVSGLTRISCKSRFFQRSGNTEWTSGRPVASAKNGLSSSRRRAASTSATLGRSPQCRSSIARITGPIAHSAASQSSHAIRIASPIAMRSARAAPSASLASAAGNGAPAISLRSSTTLRSASPERWRPRRARSFLRFTSIDSPCSTPAARFSMSVAIAKGDPALSASHRAERTSAP
jgi:hypothetical protein